MKWASAFVALATATAAAVPIVDNVDVVLPPPAGKDESMPEALLIYIPGGKVPAQYYQNTVAAIQQAANLRLWAVVPAIPNMLCISQCAIQAACTLRNTINATLTTAHQMGYRGPSYGPNVFVGGHSLGGVCGDTLVKKFAETDTAYGGFLVMGAYVAGQNVGDYATPVFTIGGELDGGGARPGLTYKSLTSSDQAAVREGYPIGGEWQMSTKPVIVLPSIDHSSFCPGFAVPGDIRPAEVSFEIGSWMIGEASAAFLHLRTRANQPASVVANAMAVLTGRAAWTRNLLQPLKTALALEHDGEKATWCSKAQEIVADLAPDDWARISVFNPYKDTVLEFTSSRVGTAGGANGSPLLLNISGHAYEYPRLDLGDGCVDSAQEIGCKMAGGAKLAAELGVKNIHSEHVQCSEVNKYAVTAAEAALQQTAAGRQTLARFKAKGRPFLFSPDHKPYDNIGPLFVLNHMQETDCVGQSCYNVSSLALGPLPLDNPVFPGVYYCKVLSPARVVDYYMTDSLKAITTCQNKEPQA